MIIDGLMNYISNAVHIIVTTLFYPVMVFFGIIQNVIMHIWNSMYSLYASILGMFGTLQNFMVSFMYGMFPDTISGLIMLLLFLVFSLRIYWFVKDISILGNKV